MTDSLTNDDTARVRAAARRGDPAREMTGLEVAFISHEQADERRFEAGAARWRQALFVGGLILSLAAWGAQQAWAAHADAAAGRAQIDDMHERIVRIESQIDRLMERTQ